MMARVRTPVHTYMWWVHGEGEGEGCTNGGLGKGSGVIPHAKGNPVYQTQAATESQEEIGPGRGAGERGRADSCPSQNSQRPVTETQTKAPACLFGVNETRTGRKQTPASTCSCLVFTIKAFV